MTTLSKTYLRIVSDFRGIDKVILIRGDLTAKKLTRHLNATVYRGKGDITDRRAYVGSGENDLWAPIQHWDGEIVHVGRPRVF